MKLIDEVEHSAPTLAESWIGQADPAIKVIGTRIEGLHGFTCGARCRGHEIHVRVHEGGEMSQRKTQAVFIGTDHSY